ncbi:NlpC/P60 family protein [Rhodococcus oxybenzonivorans]|uniref:C40 family peptidase n=1 Tax=Rhodococcus oxybenzonivorans TaxID=1990687 RepID=UPI0029555953|nr:NlpC/P60 family protein [Rhodococcus oxybenzonivorans]MDV7354828.1 NlpC/P60 family protein [Rhodococcus oxybenzonivorans]
MSVDPSALIMGVAAALGGFVQNADMPYAAEEFAMQQVQVMSDQAATVDASIDDYIELLPENSREPVRKAVDSAAETAQDALAPIVPTPPVIADVPPDRGAVEPLPGEYEPLPATPAESESESDAVWSVGESSASAVLELAPRAEVGVVNEVAAGSVSIGSIAVFVPWFTEAGGICEGVTAPVLAALYSVENGFRHGATSPVSPAGARGPGQFMPATWARYGKDADGDGKADVLGVADSVMASGNMLCDMYGQIDQWKAEGVVSGDTLDLTLAAYNAGLGAVRAFGGMPRGSDDYENQTRPYVAQIRASEERLASILRLLQNDSGEVGARIVQAAVRYLGLPYVWGGGSVKGPSSGGFDCSGLTSYAVYDATAGFILPRTSETQWNVGVEVPLSDARPGDLLFGNWGLGGPGHVAIYLGDGQMVHAPTTGDVVRIAPIVDNMKARRVVS